MLHAVPGQSGIKNVLLVVLGFVKGSEFHLNVIVYLNYLWNAALILMIATVLPSPFQ